MKCPCGKRLKDGRIYCSVSAGSNSSATIIDDLHATFLYSAGSLTTDQVIAVTASTGETCTFLVTLKGGVAAISQQLDLV